MFLFLKCSIILLITYATLLSSDSPSWFKYSRDCSEVLNDDRVKTQIPVNRTSAKISILDIKKIFRA